MSDFYDDLANQTSDEQLSYAERLRRLMEERAQPAPEVQEDDYGSRVRQLLGPNYDVADETTPPAPKPEPAPQRVPRDPVNVLPEEGMRDKLEVPEYADVTEERKKKLDALYANKTLSPAQMEEQRRQIDKDTEVPLPDWGGSPAPLGRRYVTGSGADTAIPQAKPTVPGEAPPTPQQSSLAGQVREKLGMNKPETSTEPAKPKEEWDPVGARQVADKKSAQSPGQSAWQAAYEMALVDPRRQGEMTKALEDEAAARLQAGDIAAHGRDVMAQGTEGAAHQELADLAQVQENMHARQAYLEKIGGDIESESKKIANEEIDPQGWWHNTNTWQKVLTVIAMGLGGFVQARGQKSAAVDMIYGAIQSDVAAQRANLENKWAGLKERHSILRDKAEQYGSMDVAERQQVASRLQAALLVAQAAAQRATSPIERANAQALAAQLEQKAVEVGIQMNKYVAAGYGNGPQMTKDIKGQTLVKVDGVWVDVGDAEVARNYNKQNAAATSVLSQTDELLSLLKDSDTVNPFSEKRGRLKALGKMISQEDIKESAAGGRGGSLGLLNYLNSALGSYDSYNPFERRKSIQALEQLQNKMREDTEFRRRQLAGGTVVERVNDPIHQRSGYKIIGTYDPDDYQPATPQRKIRVRPAGE